MIPYHLVKRTPEQEQERKRRMDRRHARFDMAIDLTSNEEGFLAKRDGNTGKGRTEDEALSDLFQKELEDTLYPPT